MKKRALFLSCLMAVSVFSFSGCSLSGSGDALKTDVQVTDETAVTEAEKTEEEDEPKETESAEEIDYTEVYKEITDSYCELIMSGKDPDKEELIWLSELMTSKESDEILSSVGFTIKDISDDGVPELIIGMIDDTENGIGETVNSVYTCKNGKPEYVFSGWYRNSYSLLDDGSILNRASGGAAESIFGRYILSVDGAELICKEKYFTAMNEESVETGYYFNTTGSESASESETLDVTEDEFYEKESIMASHVVPVNYTALSEAAPVLSGCAVKAEYAEDSLPDGCEEYRINKDDISSNIIFTALDDVTDFSLIALSLKDADSDDIEFAQMTMYKADNFESGQSLAAGLFFLGSIPNNGIAYTDKNGDQHAFALSESGKDGSLIFIELNEDGTMK